MAHVRFILAIAIGVFATGCVQTSITTAKRTASFSAYLDTKIGDVSLHDFILLRSALVIGGDEKQPGIGSAAAIDPRGYYLTVAHVLGDRPIRLLLFRNGANLQIEPVRVVWRGDPRKHEADLALLYNPHAPDYVFGWAPQVQSGAELAAFGLNYDNLADLSFTFDCYAGRIVRIIERSRHVPSEVWLEHTGLSHGGDSGGPVLSLDGQLLGVTFGSRPSWLAWFLGQRGYATRPDLDWLHRVIEEDFARLRKKSTAFASTLAFTSGEISSEPITLNAPGN